MDYSGYWWAKVPGGHWEVILLGLNEDNGSYYVSYVGDDHCDQVAVIEKKVLGRKNTLLYILGDKIQEPEKR